LSFNFNNFIMRILVCIIFFIGLTSQIFSQIEYIQKSEIAIKEGNYQDAVNLLEKAYQENQTTQIKNKINFVKQLISEFEGFESAMNNKNYTQAESHLNAIQQIDPTNEFVEAKRNLLKLKQQEYNAEKRKDKREKNMKNFKSSFWGDRSRQNNFGGFHLNGGFSLTTNYYNGLNGGIDFTSAKALPISVQMGFVSSSEYQYFGTNILYHNFIFNQDNISLDLGLGYKWANHNINTPFYKVGLTAMIDNKNWGGFSYFFEHGFDSQNSIGSHNISYIFGKEPTKYILYTSLTIGIIGLAAAFAK